MEKNRRVELNRNQNKAIKALLETNTRAEAAAAAGIAESTLYKYLADPVFRSVLLERENILRRDVGRRLAKDTNHVINLLSEFIEDREAINDDRLWLRALDLWVDYHLKTGDQSDIERRLTALEAAHEQNN
jgi:hypothetical protein